jgi:ubiquinone/menaquinone biosynthesis C-methylase UbiE
MENKKFDAKIASVALRHFDNRHDILKSVQRMHDREPGPYIGLHQVTTHVEILRFHAAAGSRWIDRT